MIASTRFRQIQDVQMHRFHCLVFVPWIACGRDLASNSVEPATSKAHSAADAGVTIEQNPQQAADANRQSKPEAQPSISVSEAADLRAIYANHFQIHAGKELLFDFGVTTERGKAARPEFDIGCRLALNYYTAKRLSAALAMAIDRHERAFGKLKAPAPDSLKRLASHRPVEYANFVRVSSTPEELILECALNSNPYSKGPVRIKVSRNIAMLHATAKMLQHEVRKEIEKHERKNGRLEVDPRKRILRKSR